MADRWRVSRKLGRTLYLDDECVGMVDTPEIAAAIVAALNAEDERRPRPVVYCTRCPFAMHLHPTPPEAGGCPGYA